MTLTKRELTQKLLNGEKLKPKNYSIKYYCCYDETYTSPFRIVKVNLCNNTAMNEVWNETEWEIYKETPEWWEPKNGDKVYYIDVKGNILTMQIWNCENDKSIIKQGNIFKTKEEAENELKLRAAKYRVKKRIWELNGGKFIEFNPGADNYSFDLEYRNKGIFSDTWKIIKLYPSWQYLKTKQLTDQLIRELHDDLLLIRSE